MARLLVILLLAAFLQLYGASALPIEDRRTMSWVVEITDGGKEMADNIARHNGFRNLGRASEVKSLNYIIHTQLYTYNYAKLHRCEWQV